MGKFKIISKTKLHELEIGAELSESDFACVSGDMFVQMEYQETVEGPTPYKITPGVWSAAKTMMGLILEPTRFSKDLILDSFVHTEHITNKVDKFFSRLHIYKEYGIEIPKRCMLLYGPAGSGKSSAIVKIAEKYNDNETAVIIWKTDVISPYDFKEFIKRFEYTNVKKLIVVAEDIGGIEADQIRIKSESSLLAILDNQEQAFKIPVMIICTTNYPENLLGNLSNRPQRIDDKIEVGLPSADERAKLLTFFSKDKDLENPLLAKIRQKKFSDFTPAHIKEVFVRAAIYDLQIGDAMDQIQKEIEHFKNLFTNKQKLGLGVKIDDYDE